MREDASFGGNCLLGVSSVYAHGVVLCVCVYTAVQKKKFGNLSPADYKKTHTHTRLDISRIHHKKRRSYTYVDETQGSIVPAVHLRSDTPQAQTSQTKQQAGLHLPAVSHIPGLKREESDAVDGVGDKPKK